MTEVMKKKPSEGSKWSEYHVAFDPNDDDKATEIKLCNFARPHMRAFHCSWLGFFIAFFIWFSIAPLLPEIKKSLQLEKQQIWTSNILAVTATIFCRFLFGPLCDKLGGRLLMGIVLMAASIPTALTGVVRNAGELYAIRSFIGIAGGTFVMCQYWTSRMFTKEVAGTANSLVGGWGNLGGGVTQIVMGSALFPLFKTIFADKENPASAAWRTVCIVPAVVAFVWGFILMKISDDCPKGNYSKLKKSGDMPDVSASASFRSGAMNLNTWILFLQYGCCFGVELTMNNLAASYFSEKYGAKTEVAAAIASIFGWMNLFARGLGGFSSDKMNEKLGMRGRLIVQSVTLTAEGVLVFVFANAPSLAVSVTVMVFFSVFVQAAEGSTYGIVPYVNPPVTGSIAGIVGAGGNVGAVCFGLGFRQFEDEMKAFTLMGSCIIVSGLLSLFVCIKGHSGLVFGQDSDEVKKSRETTLQIPVPDEEANN
eukprot:CAMPEP_0113328466 /NCGR_PEP_ID=MMETSP0010_2-20120614/20048_1 /TAXON_ID=216773 ORGANISM="Corethron hystrix, Strain 308" /NCGR_SAMPLE_ID=MMETSP0010_2 /ASSEMBLY_ACC=CAM_ASM_000155 /LENGTH=479 /DNA_ID=CAMNT_0000189823 /DNA_START=49 /DNA_END=1488 /DNA_ORIENTATION=+ /assembly_acc=CAM_ASM_000155